MINQKYFARIAKIINGSSGDNNVINNNVGISYKINDRRKIKVVSKYTA